MIMAILYERSVVTIILQIYVKHYLKGLAERCLLCDVCWYAMSRWYFYYTQLYRRHVIIKVPALAK